MNDKEGRVFYARCLRDSDTFRLFAKCVGEGIDSRLEALRFDVEDASDDIDRHLGWRRYDIWLERPKDLAILIYRLESLAIAESREDAEIEFRDIFHDILRLDEELEPYLLDAPYLATCPNCGTTSDNMELQDQVWVCDECGWQGNFQSKWPYVMAELNHLGRLDLFVEQRLKAIQSSNDDGE